jgi:hypothetical protein
MIVTDLEYSLEKRYIRKLDIMLERCINPQVRKDALLIIEGGEGEGKTNASEATAYYLKCESGMDIHMFFRLNAMYEFAKSTTNKIIIWDEPSLDFLSTDWHKKWNSDLIRLLMTCRKKRHFFIFNFVKFYKFNEYIVVDRALGLVHIYSRKEVQAGRLAYIKKHNLEHLYNDYKQKKLRNYKKYRAFGGCFPLVEDKLDKMGIFIEGVPNCNLEMYEKLKDKAISGLGNVEIKLDKSLQKLDILKKSIGLLKFPIKTQAEFANRIGISDKTLRNWGKLPPPVDSEAVIGQII